MISFHLAGGTFTVRPLPTLMTAIMMVTLLGLGSWQVQRLHWKQNLLTTIDQRIHQPPADIATLIDRPDAAYRPATVSGVFQNDHALFLFAISLTGAGGYHVLTPFKLDNGQYLLVDRGWIPYDHKPTDFTQTTDPIDLTGILRRPEHYLMQPRNDPAHNDWYQIDLPAMAQAARIPAFLPYVLEADDTPNQDGYPIGGQTRVTLPNNHFIYALTWFGLALALPVIYVLSCFRKDSAD